MYVQHLFSVIPTPIKTLTSSSRRSLPRRRPGAGTQVATLEADTPLQTALMSFRAQQGICFSVGKRDPSSLRYSEPALSEVEGMTHPLTNRGLSFSTVIPAQAGIQCRSFVAKDTGSRISLALARDDAAASFGVIANPSQYCVGSGRDSQFPVDPRLASLAGPRAGWLARWVSDRCDASRLTLGHPRHFVFCAPTC